VPSAQYQSTRRGGYGYPGTLSWSPVALLSRLEPYLTLPAPPSAPDGHVLATLVAERGEGFSWEAPFGEVERVALLLTRLYRRGTVLAQKSSS
jgi:hypothetical protein